VAYGNLEEIIHERYMSEFTESALMNSEDVLIKFLSAHQHIAMVATSYGYNRAPETY
jgi:hypothetical protein